MWNRPALFLWVSVRVEPPPGSGRRGFSLSLPVPVYLLFGVLDFAEDAFDVLSLFPGARWSWSCCIWAARTLRTST